MCVCGVCLCVFVCVCVCVFCGSERVTPLTDHDLDHIDHLDQLHIVNPVSALMRCCAGSGSIRV